MDLRMIHASGRKAVIIGISVGVVPIAISYLFAQISNHVFLRSDPNGWVMLCSVSMSTAQTSFHVVACLLGDLKILSSEIGRLAISSSIVSNICSFSILMMGVAYQESKGKLIGVFVVVGSLAAIILFIVYVMRPLMHWIVMQTPQGSNCVDKIYVCVVFLMVLVCSSLGQYLGYSPGLAPLILGLVVPPGPPLAETIEDKLECIVYSLFLPIFYLGSCGIVATGSTHPQRVMFVCIIILMNLFLKIISTFLSSMYYGMSWNDSFVLGLIMASLGLMDLILFRSSLWYKHVNAEIYTVLIYFSVVIAGITSILVKVMYNPSIENLAYTKRAIGDGMHNTKLRVLTCIYREFNVPSVIDLLEASNATEHSPISLYLLHLIELQRIAPSLVISHKKNEDNSIFYDRSKNIINAFRYFEEQNRDRVSLNSFTALSPCSTMHHDIFSLAVDQKVALIILPFHEEFNTDGIMEATPVIRNVNSSVLKISPCSVGILVDRRRMSSSSSIAQNKSFFHVALIFLGGDDDREVLTYGMRMAENPSTNLTVIRYTFRGDMDSDDLQKDKKLDSKLLDDFRHKFIGRTGITYREEVVSDGLGIVNAMREMREIDNIFDLIMVGRQQREKSKLFKGMSEWSEYPELGFMGEMLATSNSLDDTPILVLQQNFQIFDGSIRGSDYRIDI
ncbi:hypothetical protein ACHQM5_011977 [Ranunculus cassubicifolius]